MLARLREAGLIWPTAFAARGPCRADRARHLAAAAQAMEGRPDRQDRRTRPRCAGRPWHAPKQLRRDGADIEYLHVAVRGRFHHDKERYLYAPAPSGLGWHVYTPLEYAPAPLRVDQPRLRARRAQGPRRPARGPNGRRDGGDGPGAAAACQGHVHTSQRCGAQSLVLARCARLASFGLRRRGQRRLLASRWMPTPSRPRPVARRPVVSRGWTCLTATWSTR